MASTSPEDDEWHNFNWLRRANRGPTYTSYSQFSHLPYCSFDWGEDGYAGCSNHGGELLYLSAPSKTRGLIMARGHFATSLYASLSRSQIDFGGPSTFGLEVSRCPYPYNSQGRNCKEIILEEKKAQEESTKKDGLAAKEIKQEGKTEDESTSENVVGAKDGSSFHLGNMIDRGCFNYRWPVTEYYLDLHPGQDAVAKTKKDTIDASQGKHGNQDKDGNGEKQAQNIPQRIHSAKEQDTPQGKYSTKEGEKNKKATTSQAKHVGTCQMFSCAKGNLFYQILRIEEGGEFGMCFPDDSQIVLTIGGPVWFQSFNDGEHGFEDGLGKTMARPSMPKDKPKDHQEADDDSDETELVNDVSSVEPTDTIRYEDKEGRALEIKVYQLQDRAYKPLKLTKSPWEADNGTKYVEGRTSLTAYNAVGELPPPNPVSLSKAKAKAPRSATFLAVYRLVEKDEERGDFKWPELPTSEVLYQHVDVDPSRPNATGAMWEGIFLDRPTESEPVLDLAEFNMIGRSLEKILQVDIIPVTFASDDKPNGKEYAALVSNLFVREKVDLNSLFWKIRFLLRTHKFLAHLRKPDESSTRSEGKRKESIEEFQMKRIQTKVEHVIRYLVKALLEPGRKKNEERMMPDRYVPGESNYYYVMMTVWYVWKYFKDYFKDVPGWTWEPTSQLARQNEPDGLLFNRDRLPSDNWAFAIVDREKVQLLQWYHYGSLLKLCDAGVLPASWEGVGLRQKVARLAKAAKIISSAKLSSQEPYVADDEIFDRLSFVSDELALEYLRPKTVGTVELLSMKRVKQRDFTRSLNPGWLPLGEEASTSGPWEIHALCHHSRLVVLTKEEKSVQDWRTPEHTRAEAEVFRQKICTFLNADCTLIPCWERAHAKARRGWFRSEATAIVASTLVIILEKTMPTGSSTTNTVADGEQVPGGDTTSDQTRKEYTGLDRPALDKSLEKLSHSAHQDQKRLLLEIFHLEGVMKTQLEAFERFTNESGLLPPIQWTSFRSPRQYHPISFFNSLDDTPDLYKSDALKKLTIPVSLHNHIDLPDVLEKKSKMFKKQDIDKVLPKKCLLLRDIKAIGKDEDDEGFTWEIKSYKYEDSNKQNSANKFSWALYDSLVDQEVQHRFLTVMPSSHLVKNPDKNLDKSWDKSTAIPKEVLELLVYVIHPESAACLGDHVLNFSRFSCKTGDTWVASITLRSWRVSFEEIPRDKQSHSQPQNPSDEFCLPWNLRQVWGKVHGVDEKMIFKPEVLSIVLSTNAFGDFSKCTVISGIIDDDKIDGKMKDIVEDSRKLWQKFIHQPQTARCLVFFLLLGKFCQDITQHYEEAIKALCCILKLDSTFTNSEEEYPPEFELGVWSLDALYKLQNSLNATVSSLLRAKEELMAQIIEGPGKRGVKLERMCQEYLGDFENNLVQLTAVNARLDRRIELNTRNKDATSAVLTMRDSRTAISQNSTVQRLTYLTIGYLPMALMAAIFSIPHEQNVLYAKMARHGLSWFVGAIFIMSVTTYALAIFIGNILDFFRFPSKGPGGTGKKSRSQDPLNIWKLLGLVRDAPPNKGKTAPRSPQTVKKPEVKAQSTQHEKNPTEAGPEGKSNGFSTETFSMEEPTSKSKISLSWLRKPRGRGTPSAPV